jgi:hypothetical protein
MASQYHDEVARSSFLVTMRQVVGEIEVDPYGDGPPPHVAAFQMIALHDTPGSYEFPMADGRVCSVEVAYVEAGQ